MALVDAQGYALLAFWNCCHLVLNTTKATEEKHYFRKVALDNFKFAVVLTFIINLYVFNLITELLLVPVVAFLAMLGAVAATKTEFKPAKRLINGIMAAIGIAFVAYAVVGIATNFHGFATLKNFEDFMTPVVLTLTLLPFIYFLALYSAYESLFVWLGMRLGSDKQHIACVKRQIISACRFRLSRVGRFRNGFAHRIGPSDSPEDIANIISSFRAESGGSEQETRQVL